MTDTPAAPDLTLAPEGAVGWIVASNPERMNALTAGMWAKLPEHVPAMTKPILRAACDAPFEHTLLLEEYAEPNTFTTRAHQETVRALLAKEEKAAQK